MQIAADKTTMSKEFDTSVFISERFTGRVLVLGAMLIIDKQSCGVAPPGRVATELNLKKNEENFIFIQK